MGLGSMPIRVERDTSRFRNSLVGHLDVRFEASINSDRIGDDST